MSTGYVVGLIEDQFGSPVPYAEIWINNVKVATAFDTGAYFLSYPVGTYTVVFKKAGYTDKVVSGVQVPMMSSVHVDPVMTILVGSFRADVKTIYNSMINGAYLRLDQGDETDLYGTYTDATGFGTITGIVPGTYQAKAIKAGYDTKTWTIVVTAGVQASTSFHNMRTIGTCLIYGYATYDNDYIYNGYFTFQKPGWGGALAIGENGIFVSEIPPGTYDVVAHCTGYEDMDLGSWELVDDANNANFYCIVALDMIPE